jgi:hypothetical protein
MQSVDMTGAATAVVDAEGTVVGWTQAAERLVGSTSLMTAISTFAS